MNHRDGSAETDRTASSRVRVPKRRAGAVGLLSLVALTWTFGGTVRTQDQTPNPPYDPTKVTIANEPPFFLAIQRWYLRSAAVLRTTTPRRPAVSSVP